MDFLLSILKAVGENLDSILSIIKAVAILYIGYEVAFRIRPAGYWERHYIRKKVLVASVVLYALLLVVGINSRYVESELSVSHYVFFSFTALFALVSSAEIISAAIASDKETLGNNNWSNNKLIWFKLLIIFIFVFPFILFLAHELF